MSKRDGQTASTADEIPPLRGPKGFRAGGIAIGLKASGRLDLAAIVSDRPATAAGVMTQNLFCGAPVTVARQRLAASPRLRGLIVNSGIANACTGEQGVLDAVAMAGALEGAIGAAPGECLAASTGVIGHRLPIDRIAAETPRLVDSLADDGFGVFAPAIITTDLQPKWARRTVRMGAFPRSGPSVTILGVAKGSGMIEPNMATMLAFITTDYPLGPGQARQIVRRVADATFNCVTVDGDTSTSDMLLLLANGAAMERRTTDAARDERFEAALREVCESLARQIARDGEGANHLVTIEVNGAPDDDGARRIAKAIANSKLVKTALFGHDPNWGRICCAAGYAGVPFKPEEFDLKLQGRAVMRAGLPARFDRAALAHALRKEHILIQATVGPGRGRARVWTCDLSYDYVRINAEYTT
ncbi:MAG TPA: bifunctional glutamate N-acetyltransferase/amino-acid acetyltransferase ArgJ [Candidatus Sumerlaeota bacterium]|nr:bifunctional glutamate N-acetyltransferase/amino-acid acetyltransferase ArgJ [Candidatus Sumerlaeota bacterium]